MSGPEKLPVTEEEIKDVRRHLSELEKTQRVPPLASPKIGMRDERCGNCRFYVDFECHRFPPYSGPEEDCWPLVPSTGWCGEWKPKGAK